MSMDCGEWRASNASTHKVLYFEGSRERHLQERRLDFGLL